MYQPIPGFEDLQAEFHAALPRLVNGQWDWTDQVPLLSNLDRAPSVTGETK